VVGARVSHCLQKSLARLVAQRSAVPERKEVESLSPSPGPVNGGLATTKRGARERNGCVAVKRGRLVGVSAILIT